MLPAGCIIIVGGIERRRYSQMVTTEIISFNAWAIFSPRRNLFKILIFTRKYKSVICIIMYGRAFEHLINMELTAHSGYSELNYPIACWKTASGFEVDSLLGEHEIAVEVKGSEMVTNKHLKGIRAFKEEYQARSYIVVSLDTHPRRTEDGIEILPWKVFLDRLWGNEILG
jgi:predicted AAA+ superfamily ATPase